MRHANSRLKPYLTEAHRGARFVFAAEHLLRTEMRYKDHSFTVHIDEKWFYIYKVNQKFYVFPEEEVPARFVHNKKNMTKIMFLIAVARPKYNIGGNCYFDGKIGIWPFSEQTPAKKNSKNCPAGTMEWKNYKVTRQRVCDMLYFNLLPAIQQKMCTPLGLQRIDIQWDNAPVHFREEDREWEWFSEGFFQDSGIQFFLVNQPARSPDLKICDLSICSVLQKLQWALDTPIGAVSYTHLTLPTIYSV